MASSPVARVTGRVAVPVLGLFWLAVTTVPFLFMVMTSFKSQQESFSSSVWALPEALDFVNYESVLNGPFLTYFKNSVMVVVISVVLIMLISAMAAFAFARMRFRFNEALFGLVVAGMIVPIHITLVPIYLMTRQMGLYDSQFALIGPYVATSLPISVFILTEFMRQIPKELEEAARLDGCGRLEVFFRIVLPLSGPAIASGAIFQAVFNWNEFILALLMLTKADVRTLPVGIYGLTGQYSADWPALMAGLAIATLPLIVIFLLAQRHFVRSLAGLGK